MLEVGKAAPNFSLKNAEGQTIELGALKGKNVVLYFYPKDDTPGCTTEACNFNVLMPDFSKIDAVILGVSKDSEASHQKFKKKFDLKFDLLADVDGKTVEDYGVWVEKSMYGRKYMGIERATYLIDKTGIIRNIWRNVKVPGHDQDVLKAVQQL